MQKIFNSRKLLLNGFFALLLGAFTLACDTNSKNQTSSSARNRSLNASANTNTRTGDPALPSGQTSGQTQSATTATLSSGGSDKDMERYASKEAKEAIAFMVRSDRLESVQNNAQLGFSFGVPKGFQEIAFTALPPKDIARKFNASSVSNISMTPLQAFSDGRNSFVVSSLSAPANLSKKEFLDLYETLNKNRFAPALLTITAFKNRDLEMTQLFIQESERGLFRIITKGKKANEYAQFDYTIQRTTANADMEKIESSIGSILRINENINNP
jgi:hypothetical protein